MRDPRVQKLAEVLVRYSTEVREGDVVAIGADLAEVARHILNRMLSGGGELVTLIAGAHAPPGLAAALEEHLGETHPDVEVGVYDGGQDRYPLLVAVE